MSVEVGGGKLHWATGIDNSGLKKDADEAVNIVNRASEQMTKKEMFKQAITQQKELIKSVEEDIKRMQKLYDNMSPGVARNAMGGLGSDLGAAKRALAEEQANLKKIQEQGIQTNEAEVSSQSTLISSIKSWAIGVFSVTAAIKAFKSIMESTSGTAVWLHSEIEGLKTGFDYLKKSIATMDFTDFFTGLKNAIQAGREYIKEKEHIAGVERQYGLKSLQLTHEINEQRRIFYESDPEKENFDAKLKAGDEMLKKMKEKADLEIEIAEMKLAAISDVTNKKNKLAEGEAVWAINNFKLMEEEGKKYNWLRNLVDQYYKEKKRGFEIDKGKGNYYVSQGYGLPLQEMTKENLADFEARMAEMGPDGKMAGDILKKYQKLTEAEKDIIYQASADLIKANNQYLAESRMAYRMNERMETKAYNDKMAKQEAISEYEQELNQRRLDNAIKIDQAVLDAQVDSAEKQRAQAELDFQKTIADLDKQKAELIKKKNELSGGIKHGKRTDTYDPTLPADLVQQDAELRQQAEEKKNNDIAEINRKANLEWLKIEREMTGQFVGEVEKRKIAINSQYDEFIRRAVAASATSEQIAQIEKNRSKALLEAESEVTTKVTEYWKRVFSDISDFGYKGIMDLVSQTKQVIESATQKEEKGQTFYMVNIEEIDKEGKAVQKNVRLTVEEFNQLEKKYNDLVKIAREKNPFKAVADSWKELLKSLKKGNQADIGTALEIFDKTANKAIQTVTELSEDIGILFGQSAEQTLKSIIDVAKGLKDVGVGFGKLMSGDIVGGALQMVKGLATTVSTLWKGEKQYQKDREEWWAKAIAQAVAYKNALIDVMQMQTNKNNSVFINDYADQILQASEAIEEAQKQFNRTYLNAGSHGNRPSSLTNAIVAPTDRKTLSEYLDKLEIQVGVTQKKFLGLITTGSKPVYGSLLKEYPELIDKAGKFNVTVAESILQMDGLPEATKNGLTALIEYSKQVEESEAAIASAISSMAGFIADNLRDALVTAWDDGTDAFQAFKTSVTQGLKEIVQNMIFNAVFGAQFKQLEDDLAKSFGVGGDQSITDDLKKFYESAPELVQKWLDGMTAAQQEAMAAGMDWTTAKQEEQLSGLAGAIQQDITEQTASVIAGQMNAMQINVIEQLRVFRESVIYQRQIAENTAKANDLLTIISTRVSAEDNLRAVGL